MKSAPSKTPTATTRAGIDKLLYSDQTAHIMVVELLIKWEEAKREIAKLEARLQWAEVQKQGMTNGKGR